MRASKRWQPKNVGVVPRQTHVFKEFIRGCEVTVRRFESALEAAKNQGFLNEAPQSTGFSDGSAGRYIQGGHSTVVYRGLV